MPHGKKSLIGDNHRRHSGSENDQVNFISILLFVKGAMIFSFDHN
jgi:hypothetical protein